MRKLKDVFFKQLFFYRNNSYYLNLNTWLKLFAHVKYRNLKKIRHRFALYKLEKILACFSEAKIGPIVILGTLLGAIRSNGFAGRPADIDFLIIEQNTEEFIEILRREGFRVDVRRKYETGHVIKVTKFGPPVDVIVSETEYFEKERILVFRKLNNHKVFSVLYEDYENKCISNIYAVPVFVPGNAQKYLNYWYGDDWHIPQVMRPKSNEPTIMKER
jgi:hypothetical protein